LAKQLRQPEKERICTFGQNPDAPLFPKAVENSHKFIPTHNWRNNRRVSASNKKQKAMGAALPFFG